MVTAGLVNLLSTRLRYAFYSGPEGMFEFRAQHNKHHYGLYILVVLTFPNIDLVCIHDGHNDMMNYSYYTGLPNMVYYYGSAT